MTRNRKSILKGLIPGLLAKILQNISFIQRKIYKKTEKFYTETMPGIADKIVAGEEMDLAKFDFGFTQESLLMALVLTRHGRRLLLPDENFPKNTKELHRFLK